MSKIFEALAKAQNALPDVAVGKLLEGQVETGHSPSRQEHQAAGARQAPKPAAPEPLLPAVRVLPLRVAPTAPILPFDGSHYRAGEQYRLLRTRLIQHPKSPQVMVVTSAGPNDGKSVTAINIAGVLALKSEGHVLLIDGDFRRGTIHTQLGLPSTPGLADVLKGQSTLADVMIRAEQVPNLFVLPGGESATNPTELLDSSRWTSLIASCRSQFKYIVVDSPPIATVADYDLIQAACDGVILVARPDHTNRQLCLKAIEMLPKGKSLGVVLNCTSDWWFSSNDSSYASYYYYGRQPHKTP